MWWCWAMRSLTAAARLTWTERAIPSARISAPGVAQASPNYYAGGGGYGAGGSGYGGSPGGGTYGSLTQPAALGSAGGTGLGQPGTAGGGAIRLTVSGTLTLNGALSANGADNPGGYSGAGLGRQHLADGRHAPGDRDNLRRRRQRFIGRRRRRRRRRADRGLLHASKRVQLCQSSVRGGQQPFNAGTLNGSTGTVYVSSVMVAPVVVSATPYGGAARPMASHVDLVFNVAIDPATFTTADVTVTTPSGAIPSAQLTVSNTGGTQWRISFRTKPPKRALPVSSRPAPREPVWRGNGGGLRGKFRSQPGQIGRARCSGAGWRAAGRAPFHRSGRDELSTSVLHEPGELAGGRHGDRRRSGPLCPGICPPWGFRRFPGFRSVRRRDRAGLSGQSGHGGGRTRRSPHPLRRAARKRRQRLERFKENCSQLRCSVRPPAESVEPEARRYNLERFCGHDFF